MVLDYALDDEPHALRLLQIAAESWDRRQQARQAVAKDGAFIPDRFGQPKAHPALAVERDMGILFARALRELALPLDDPDANRPPRVGTGATD